MNENTEEQFIEIEESDILKEEYYFPVHDLIEEFCLSLYEKENVNTEFVGEKQQ